MPKFTDLLINLPQGMQKTSQSPEAPDNQQMEQDFARLAYTFLQDRASGLVPYLLGFEVVERSEDGDKAVGIFGCKVGDGYYYIPAFFINNQIKGMDLLYIKGTNMFVPLKETWINYITNKQTIQLGDAAENSAETRRTFEQPNFDYLVKPPLYPGIKRGSAQLSAERGFEVWNEMQLAIKTALESDPDFQSAYCGAIQTLEGRGIEKTAEGSDLVRFMQLHGGPAAVAEVLHAMQDIKFANAALSLYPSIDSLVPTVFDASLQTVKRAAKIVVETEDSSPSADGEKREKILRDGFTIQDNRDDNEKSEVYPTEYYKRYSNPTEPGRYNVLLRNGGCAECWVLQPAYTRSTPYLVCVDVKGKHSMLADGAAVFVRDDRLDGESAFDAAGKVAGIEVGGQYCFVGPSGGATPIVRISSIMTENGTRERYSVSVQDYDVQERPTYGHDFDNGPFKSHCCCPCSGIQELEFSDRHSKPALVGETLIVPTGWKALEINEIENYDARKLFKPGSLVDVTEAMNKAGIHKMAVDSDGLEYHVRFDGQPDGSSMNYKTACLRLVGAYGFTERDAKELLKDAQSYTRSNRLVKLAQIQSSMVGVNMGNMPQPSRTGDAFTGATVEPSFAYQQGGQFTGVQRPRNSVTPGFNLGGEAQQDQNAAGIAQQAAGAGQKKVFDHAVIGGLAKMYDSAAVMDTYVPDFLSALDKLGRVLFLFYWKNEEFSERYGSEDMAEMEDTIRAVFKQFGDLILKLRQKSIESDDSARALS